MSDKKFEKKLAKMKKDGERMKQEAELKAEYEQYYPKKKKKKVSNIMLFVVVVAIIGYVLVDFVLQYRVGLEISPTITGCWFAFWGTEVLALTGIKVSKVKSSTSEEVITSDEADACG